MTGHDQSWPTWSTSTITCCKNYFEKNKTSKDGLFLDSVNVSVYVNDMFCRMLAVIVT